MNIIKLNELEVDKIPLEVKLDDGGYYTVFVESLNETEAIIMFERGWHPVIHVPYGDLRLAREQTISNLRLTVGMEIDAHDCSIHHRHKSYWRGVLTNLTEAYGRVRFEARADILYKNIPTKDLYFMHSSPPLCYENFYTFTFTIEEKYDECLITSLPLLKATLGAAVTITYYRTSGNLILRSPFMKCIERAEIFKSTFLESIEKKYRVMQRLEKIRHKIRISKTKGYLQVIEFDESLTSYILRKGKHYLRSARNIDGISFVSIHNDPSRFIVYGKTKEALIRARQLLQYVQQHIFIPERMLLQFAGENNSTLNEAMTMHDLAQILIPEQLPFNNIPDRKNETACVLVGINENVSNAKQYLESHLNRLKESWNARTAELSKQVLVIHPETSNLDSTSESCTDDEDENSEIEINQQESQNVEQFEDEEVQVVQSSTTVAVSQTCEQLNVTPTTPVDSNSPSANELEERPPSTSEVINQIAPLTDVEENTTSSEHSACSFATESAVNIYFESTTTDDDSVLEDNIKITLIGWILKTGYQGPLLEKVALHSALHEKTISVHMMQLICSITDEIQSLCNLHETIEPVEENFLFEVFSGQLFSLLRELECPYAALFKGIVQRRLQCKCRKKLLLKYLISELLCARLLNSPLLLYNMGERLRHRPQEIQRNALLKVINIPCYPSQKTMALLSSQLNVSSFENSADAAEESQRYESDSDEESSELERENERLKNRVEYLENFILSMQGEHPEMQGEHPEMQGEHPEMQGEHPEMQGEHPEMQGEHPEMQINPDLLENMEEEPNGQIDEFLDHLYHEVSDEEDNENLENNDNEQEAEEIPQDLAAAGDIGLIDDEVPQQIVNRGAGDELEE